MCHPRDNLGKGNVTFACQSQDRKWPQHAPDLNVRQRNVCVQNPRFSFCGENEHVSTYKNMTEQETIKSVHNCVHGLAIVK